MLEQPGAFAEQHRSDGDQHLVQDAGAQALRSHVGAEDGDVLVAGSGGCLVDGRVEAGDKGEAGKRVGRWMVGEHELGTVPAAAERSPSPGRPLSGSSPENVRRPVSSAPTCGISSSTVGLGPMIFGQPGHVAVRAGDETVDRHRRRVEEFRHPLDAPRETVGMATVDVEVHTTIDRPRPAVAAYCCDPANVTAWYANIKAVQWETEPPVTLGSRFRFTSGFLGRTLEYTYEVVELAPTERFVMRLNSARFQWRPPICGKMLRTGTPG